MAFSNSEYKSTEQYDALTFFENTPVLSKMQTPDPRIINIELKGWVSMTVLAFKITARAGTNFQSTIEPTPANSPDPKTLNLAVYDQSGYMQDWSVYRTIDMGNNNASSNDWTITFDIKANNQSTGKWVFRKGGSEPNF